MIGAFDFNTWTEDRIQLTPGDLLCIFSDGVVEAERDDNQYGEERMEAVLRSHLNDTTEEISHNLFSDIVAFVGDAPQSDDITFLLIKRV
jgi:sigma-B regulation protein RsbU (phosphoserine phosphatase)